MLPDDVLGSYWDNHARMLSPRCSVYQPSDVKISKTIRRTWIKQVVHKNIVAEYTTSTIQEQKKM
jgi:hypothetical protein